MSLFERFDWLLFIATLTLSALSLIALYGIGISQDPASLFAFYKQVAAVIIGVGAVFGLTFFDYRYLRAYGLIIYLAGTIPLISVLFFGHASHGAQAWFRLGALSFQPVEIAKFCLIIYLSSLFVRLAHGRLNWRAFTLSGIATFGYVGLVLLQPDFGSSMVMVAIWGLMAMFAGLPRRAWIILPLIIAMVGGLWWSFAIKPYQRDRILIFLNLQSDPKGSGYNAAQARIAIGSGGWFGKGLSEGSQARLRFLPEASTDFMFAVIGEELGFVGVCLVLGLFFLLLYRELRLASQVEDDFGSLLLIGIGAEVLIHVSVNAGMNLGIMPVTGIPLPFISAAASSMVVGFLGIGVAESVAVRRRGKSLSQ